MNCTRWAARIAVPAVAVLLLAACGQEEATTAEEPTENASESAPAEEETSPSAEEPEAGESAGLPECAEVWVAEAAFPEEYAGCLEGGEEAQDVRHRCSFGLPIIEHAGRYYAVPGGPVNDVGDIAASKQFKRALTNCQG